MPVSRPRPLDNLDDDRSFVRRDSFIDMASPTTPAFPVDADTHRTSEDTLASSHTQRPTINRKQDIRVDTYSPSSYKHRKPPLPTTPKPNFKRPNSAGHSPSPLSRSTSSSPKGRYLRADFQAPTKSRSGSPDGHIPPTTNFLSTQERADLVRKSRKLTQLLGQTPSLASVSRRCEPGSQGAALSASMNYGKHHRGALSVAEGIGSPTRGWPSHQSPVSPTSPGGRRYSAPPSPLDVTVFGVAAEEGGMQRRGSAASVRSGRDSFIDLSEEGDGGLPGGEEHEEEGTGSETDAGSCFGDDPAGRRSSPYSPSSSSLSLSMSSQDRAEDERRRKRERLAKLHRFLGSRVPADLVLGSFNTDTSLPRPSSSPTSATPTTDPKSWRRLRRRSSSAAEMKSRWFDEDDRVKADLDDHEKAINVRRAVKMEKMFGVQPPQTLYRTRNSPVTGSPARIAPPERQSSLPPGPSSPTGRNINQSAYINKGRSSKSHRSSTYSNESTQNLLGGSHEDDGTSLHPGQRASSIYIQYRHSLNSLNDIIDRDDRESIAEIHQYLTRDGPPTAPYEAEDSAPTDLPDTSSIRSERRRSLPTRASTLSLASQFNRSLQSPEPEMVNFQARRRQAAKLTSFFGVDYRDLIGDILESIEHDVEEASHRGSLQPEEVQDLLRKLRKLKTKRQGPLK